MNKEGEQAHASSMTGTKWELFNAAISLFAAKGYANVSVRDIAAAMNLNPASIYNHFPSKEAFLAEAYKFYRCNYYSHLPPIDELLELTSKISPTKVWEKLQPIYEPKLLELMTKIALIALDERRRDPAARALVAEVFIEKPKHYVGAVIEEMIQRGIIEPIDVENFTNIHSAFNLYASMRNGGDHNMSARAWQDGHKFIFSFLSLKKS